MAFNGIGFATIAPGGSFRWGVIRNGGQDQGAQIVEAHPETPGSIMTDSQTIDRDGSGSFTYHATFHNITGNNTAVSFSMCGGGLE
jgi:hypothetical protein